MPGAYLACSSRCLIELRNAKTSIDTFSLLLYKYAAVLHAIYTCCIHAVYMLYTYTYTLCIYYPSPSPTSDGWLKPNDIITAINGQSLEGVPHSEAVRLLQAVRGVVQLSCLREQELAPPSSPSPHAHPPPSPLTLTSHPSPSPSAHAHPPPSPLTLLPHHHASPSAHAQPPPSPLSLTPHPPPSPHTAPQAPPSPSHPLSDSPHAAVHIPEETYNTTSNTPVHVYCTTCLHIHVHVDIHVDIHVHVQCKSYTCTCICWC